MFIKIMPANFPISNTVEYIIDTNSSPEHSGKNSYKIMGPELVGGESVFCRWGNFTLNM